MAKGIIYIMLTSLDGVVKIGKTDNLNSRFRSLQEGYKRIFITEIYYAIKTSDYTRKETLIHRVLARYRIDNTELFAIDKDLVKELLEAFEGEQVYPDKNAKTIPGKRRPNLKLVDIKIANGAKLSWYKDPSVTCTVVDNVRNKVEYEGETYTLSGLVKHLFNDGSEYQGSAYLMYKGKYLTELRDEMGV